MRLRALRQSWTLVALPEFVAAATYHSSAKGTWGRGRDARAAGRPVSSAGLAVQYSTGICVAVEPAFYAVVAARRQRKTWMPATSASMTPAWLPSSDHETALCSSRHN